MKPHACTLAILSSFAGLVTTVGLAEVAHARTWHVDYALAQFIAPPDRDGDEDSPFLTIGAALARAVAGDVVLVHPESYAENLDLPAGVELRAAFPAWGADTALEDITQLVVDDRSRPGILVGGADPRTAIIGFQITDGGAERGGAIHVVEGRARIEDNFFFLNAAEGAAPLGGAIAVFDAPDDPLPAGEHHVVVRNNGFAWNTAHTPAGTGRGGAIACRANRRQPKIMIDANEFRAPVAGFENSADLGGAVYIEQCEATVRDNWFEDNRARMAGGGLYCTGAGSNAPAPITLSGNLVRGNSVGEGAGGGFHLSRCLSRLDHNTIGDNVAKTDGGGVYCVGLCALGANVGRNHFERNSAERHGGGLAVIDPELGSRVERNVFRDNEADADADGEGAGGGIHVAATVTGQGLDGLPVARVMPIEGRLDDDSLIEDNSAARGGGVAVAGRIADDGDVVAPLHVPITAYAITGNQATYGGGVYIGGAAHAVMGDLAGVFFVLAPPRWVLVDANLALADGGGVHVDARGALTAVGNYIGEPDLAGNLAEDGEGGGVWAHASATVSAWFNCFAKNRADRGGGVFGGAATQSVRANSFFGNAANTGGGAFIEGGTRFSLNAVHDSTGGGVSCGPGGGLIEDNRIQANDPFDLDEAACGEGVDNHTGALARVRGVYGVRHRFVDCGPPEPDEPEGVVALGDFGDAPDDTHGAFSAGYRAPHGEVVGRFATYAASDNAAEGRGGPSHGLVDLVWLGAATSSDGGAESDFDEDDVPNLDRTTLASDQDAHDDGWAISRLSPCATTEVTLEVTASELVAGSPLEVVYLNVVADWDHDGRWGGDSAPCGEPVAEWVVRDLAVRPEPGASVAVMVPIATGDAGDVWLRVMVAESPIGDLDDWDGSAPAPFLIGETEDHRVCVGDSDEDCEDHASAEEGPAEETAEPTEHASEAPPEPTEEVSEEGPEPVETEASAEPGEEVAEHGPETSEHAEVPDAPDPEGADGTTQDTAAEAEAEAAPRPKDDGCGGARGGDGLIVLALLAGAWARSRRRWGWTS